VTEINHVFISHSEKDYPIVRQLAEGLETAGFNTWYYERDSIPGLSYILQTATAIDNSIAVVLIISENSLTSHQISNEVVRTHEINKPFIPLLFGITHVEFQNRKPEWRQAIGSSTSLMIKPDDIHSALPRIIAGLEYIINHDGNNQIQDKMLNAFVLPAFLIAWASNGKLSTDLQDEIQSCCNHLNINYENLAAATNHAGEINNPSVTAHLAEICKKYLAIGTLIAQTCGTIQLRDHITQAGHDWKKMLTVAKHKALEQSQGLFPPHIIEALNKAFSQENPDDCLAAIQKWHLMASETLGTDTKTSL
jgi:hypothetical protein